MSYSLLSTVILLSTATKKSQKEQEEAENRVTKLSAALKAQEQTLMAATAEKEAAEEAESRALGICIAGYMLFLMTLGKSKFNDLILTCTS
jgi:mannitol-specific phosphotransferase system IIBC component